MKCKWLCGTEVGTLWAELAQTRKGLQRAEELAALRTQILQFGNLLEADKVHHKKGP